MIISPVTLPEKKDGMWWEADISILVDVLVSGNHPVCMHWFPMCFGSLLLSKTWTLHISVGFRTNLTLYPPVSLVTFRGKSSNIRVQTLKELSIQYKYKLEVTRMAKEEKTLAEVTISGYLISLKPDSSERTEEKHLDMARLHSLTRLCSDG